MRMVSGWDSLLKRYLSECPGKPVLSVYPRAYKRDEEFKEPEIREGPLVMCLKEFSKLDGLPRFVSKVIQKPESIEKPFHSFFWAAGFSFSKGTLITDCPYSEEVDDVFFGEELYLMLKFHQQGYSLYSPPCTLAYHLWERAYRRTYAGDHQDRRVRQQACLSHIRTAILSDAPFLADMLSRRGVDLVNKTFTRVAECGGLDPSFI